MPEHHHRQEEPLDATLFDHGQQGGWIDPHPVGDEHKRSPGLPGREDLLERYVESEAGELERAGGFRHTRGLPGEQIDQRTVRHGDALRSPRGARRIEHVGQRLWGCPLGSGRGGGVRPQVEPRGIDGRGVRRTAEGGGILVGEQQRGAGCLQHPLPAQCGPSAVEGQIRRPRLEDSEDRHHQLDGTVEAHRHQCVGACSLRDEMMREPVGPGIEIGVGERAVVADQRHGVGRPCGLPLEQSMDDVVGAVPRCTALPSRDPLPLGGREQSQAGGGGVGITEQRSQQRQQVTDKPLDAVAGEPVGIVGQLAVHSPPLVLADEELQVEPRASRGNRQSLHGEAQHAVQRRQWHRGDLEHHLHERVAGGVSGDLLRRDDLLEGKLLIGVGFDRGRADLREQLPEALPTLETHADRQRVDEEPHQVLELRMVAAPHGNTDREVFLLRMTVQHHRHGGEQPHVQRGPLRPT